MPAAALPSALPPLASSNFLSGTGQYTERTLAADKRVHCKVYQVIPRGPSATSVMPFPRPFGVEAEITSVTIEIGAFFSKWEDGSCLAFVAKIF